MVRHLNIGLGFDGPHDQGRFLGRADIGTVAAAHAVEGIDLYTEMIALQFLAQGLFGFKSLGSCFTLFIRQQNRTNGGVGADHGTLVALDAVFQNPLRYIDGHPSFLVLGGGYGEKTIRSECTHRKFVTLLCQHRTHDLGNKFRFMERGFGIVRRIRP